MARAANEAIAGSHRRWSTSKDSHHSILSPEMLQEHDKSQLPVITGEEDAVSRISSWISGVALNPLPAPNQTPAFEPTESVNVNLPKPGWQAPRYSIDVTSASGTHLIDKPEQVEERVKQVQSLLFTDEDGRDVQAVQPCPHGRYVPHSSDDSAFNPIDFNQIHHVDEPGSCESASMTSIATSRFSHGHEKLVAQMRRASSIAKQLNERRSSRERRLSGERRLSADTNVTTLTSTDQTSEAASTVGTSKATTIAKTLAPKLGIGTGVKLHKWKKRAENVKTKGHQKFAVIPLPLRIAMHEELFPVICQTVKCYEKQLGKKHQLTKEAVDKCNSMARWGSVLTDL